MSQTVKNLPTMQEAKVPSLGWENPPGEGNGNPLQYLPGKSHGQRSMAGYSPWGYKELDMTEQLTHTLGSAHIHTWEEIPQMCEYKKEGIRLPASVFLGFSCGSAGKESACNAGDLGSVPELGRSPGEGKATHSSIVARRIPWTV